MKNRKGFTLVELLAVIVILGVITGMSIPLIRNLQKTMQNKKYTAYLTSLKTSAKLYNDSYSDDLFGHNKTGVVCLTYKELEEKKLLKDIGIDDISCDTENTFVRITKLEDKYVYVPYLACGKKENGKVVSIEKTLPEETKEVTDEFCSQDINSTIVISADNTYVGETYDKKRKKTSLTISSVTGIYNKIVLYTAWSTSKTPPSDSEFVKTDFKVEGNQKEKLLNGTAITTKSNDLITPKGADGLYYLHVKVVDLKDIYGNRWRNPDDPSSQYIKFGPFAVDNTPPECPQITSVSNNKTYTPNTWTNGNINFTFKFDSDTNNWNWYTNTGNGSYTDWGNNNKTVTTKEISGEGTRHIKLVLYDLAKNKKECTYTDKNYNIDKTAPTLVANVYQCKSSTQLVKAGGSIATKTVNNTTKTATILSKNVTGNTNEWFNKNYAGLCYEFKETDNLGILYDAWEWNTSGLSDNASGYQTLNGGNSINNYTAISTSKTYNHSLSAEGHRYARMTVKDQAGNTVYIDVEAKLDRTGPACGDAGGSSTSWTKSDRVINQVCNDSYSGCEKSPYQATFTTTTKTSSITMKDKAGNTSSCAVNVYVDKKAPTCGTATGSSTSWTNQNRAISQGCNDSDSGCSKTTFNVIYTSTTKVGSVTISDNAGNTATCSHNVYVDTTPPSCETATGASTSWTNSSRTIKQGCVDSESGCSKATFDTTYSTSTKTSSVTIKDMVGNAASCSYNVYVDTDKPSCSTSKTSTGTSGVSGKITCSDSGGSACKSSNTSTFSNKKSDTTFSVYDNAGNKGTCKVSVSSKTTTYYRTAKSCAAAGCNYAWKNITGECTYRTSSDKSCTGTSSIDSTHRCKGNGTMSTTADSEWSCKGGKQEKYCASYKQSGTACGWNDWSTTSCTVSSNICESKKETKYS